MKKINSEIKIDNNIFSIKTGTTDKKNPNIVYIEIGSYIIPTKEKDSYKEDINELFKSIKSKINSLISYLDLYNNNSLFIFEIADDRIFFKKSSYLNMQIYLNPKEELLKSCEMKFSNISNNIEKNLLNDILNEAEILFQKYGYELSKVKK